MGTPNKYKKELCGKAFEVLATGESLAAVCDELGITRPTLYDWKDRHPEFKESIDRGLQRSQRIWERIGKDGVTGNYEKFAAAPWIFTMKNRFRDDYAEEKEDKSVSDKIVEAIIDKLID